MINLDNLTADEAHRIVANWVRKNHRGFSYKDELALRDVMVEYATNGHRNTGAFLDYVKNRFPGFYQDVMG